MLISNLISNAAIIVSFMFLGGEVFKDNRLTPKATLKTKILAGLIGGIMGIVLMVFSVNIYPNIVLDLRHFAIIVLAFHGGLIASVITGIIMAVFRITFFGVNSVSIIASLSILMLSIICGIIGSSKINGKNKWILMNLAGVITVNFVLYNSIVDMYTLQRTIIYFTLMSTVVGFFIYYLSNHIVLSNVLFTKYRVESNIADNLTDLVTFHDADGTYIYLSPSCKKILGYRPEELIGTNAFNLFYHEDLEAISKSHSVITNTDSSYSVIYRIKRKDGKIIWFETTSRSIRDKDGKVEQLICVSRDISERKMDEIKLQKSHEKINSILESIKDAFFALDKDFCFKYLNKQSELLLEKSRDDLIGKNIWDVFSEDVKTNFYENYNKALHEQTQINFEEFYAPLNKYFSVRVYPTEEGISVFYHDITEKKMMECEIQKSNRKFRAIFEHAGIGIAVRDVKGKPIDINATYKELLGYQDDELQVVHAYVHPEDAAKDEENFKKLLRGNIDSYRIEKRYYKKNGGILYGDVVITMIPETDNEQPYVIGMVNDITSMKIAEQRLIRSENRFRSLVNSMNDIVYTLDKDQKHTAIYGKWLDDDNLGMQNFIGKTSRDIFGEEASKIHEEANIKALNGEYVVYDWSLENNGGKKHYQTSLSPIRNSKDNIIGVVGVGRDITKQKKLEKELMEANANLKSMSLIDGLTNIPNRRAFDEGFEKEWNRSIRNSTNLALLLLDIDCFKFFNDTYGHLQGDECLKLIASTLRESISRSGDIVARYGGEEFAIILPETSNKGAMFVAEQIRIRVEDLKIPNTASKVKPYVTVSIGVASVIASSFLKSEDLIKNADKALYNAKESGRNKVELYSKNKI
ncbi:PAS domain S-box protein [Alkaliphilus serpentinus]|uniref:PAS domain S-box protein n=1 Tax=Alkaliphilus serpentinus TaxID=1482731 RepID=A0A833M6H8_9FIRM|nr:PAS domain S-box protein [Alkaliphilus serpentinus]KAB3527451.1 PAS domain S-box protein [Alkaliphilus serpentinus]